MCPANLQRTLATARTRVASAAAAMLVLMAGLTLTTFIPGRWAEKERQIASNGFEFLADVRRAQARYREVRGCFANDLEELDLRMPHPAHFSLISSRVSGRWGRSRWVVTLRRPKSLLGYGGYIITFSQDGFEPRRSTVPDVLSAGWRSRARQHQTAERGAIHAVKYRKLAGGS